MKRSCLALLALVLFAFCSSSWAQCPEDPNDRGNCDTLHVTCLDCEQTPGTGPWQVRFPILVTHDQTQAFDSIAGFLIPLSWTRTNPAKYCSLSLWWNTNYTLWVFPDFSTRSIFRHILNDSDPTDTLMHNRMAQLAADFSERDWDTRILEVSTDDAYARMLFLVTSQEDQMWWEGDRVLLATLTFVIEDTMTICMDTTFWPPTSNLEWYRADAVTYVPRDDLPHCFTVGPAPTPDFSIALDPDSLEIQAGSSGNLDVNLTALYGFGSTCTLKVANLPLDASGSFNPDTLTPTGTSNLQINTAVTTPVGVYTALVIASEMAKGTVDTALLVLTVTPPPDSTIRIVSVTDVGNDQGRQVRVKWYRSYYDTVGSPFTITQYSMWRRIDDDKGRGESYFSIPNLGRVYPPGDWDFIKTVPARGESTYSTVCPTLGDSTQAQGMYWSVFFVSAMTADPLVYFDSDPDSGYSLDNIPPLPIEDLKIDPNSWFTLHWTVPGEYEEEQPISSYDIRYSTDPVGADTQAWWDNAQACTGDGFFNLTVGGKDSFRVAGETGCHPELYLAIKGLDDRPNASGISNVVHFLCGDDNGDGIVNVGDVVYEVSYLFRNGPAPSPRAAGDVNCDGIENVGDIVYKVSYLYRGGPPPCGL